METHIKPMVQEKWDAIYENRNTFSAPSEILLKNLKYLPKDTHTKVLEIACGLGANSLFLAAKGYYVDAWDISPIAINKLRNHSNYSDRISAVACDVLQQELPENSYDMIIVAHFLERELIAKIVAALKPSGVLFYQTFLKAKSGTTSAGPNNPAFLLEPDELPQLFSALNVLAYEEDRYIGDPQKGYRNEAMLVAQKP